MGYTRLNFNYFLEDQEIDYIQDALDFVSQFGWMLLPHYQFDPENGYWINRDEKEAKVRSWLGQIDYSSGQMSYANTIQSTDRRNVSFVKRNQADVLDLSQYVDEARLTLVRVVENYKNLYGKSVIDQRQLIPEPFQKLIWFLFPSEVLPELMSMKY